MKYKQNEGKKEGKWTGRTWAPNLPQPDRIRRKNHQIRQNPGEESEQLRLKFGGQGVRIKFVFPSKVR